MTLEGRVKTKWTTTKSLASLWILWFLGLQKLRNRAARVFTFSNYDAAATELFEFLGWKNLARQQEIHKATMMFRCLHGLAPEFYLNSKFTCF